MLSGPDLILTGLGDIILRGPYVTSQRTNEAPSTVRGPNYVLKGPNEALTWLSDAPT